MVPSVRQSIHMILPAIACQSTIAQSQCIKENGQYIDADIVMSPAPGWMDDPPTGVGGSSSINVNVYTMFIFSYYYFAGIPFPLHREK
jgi:hypothetical protein